MLKARLKTIFNLIKDDTDTIVDIGSDHAFLSIALLEAHKIKHAINIEINSQPLNNGLKNVQTHHLENFVTFYLNDGLKNLTLKSKIDYICVSGLGADTIIDIIINNKTNSTNFYLLQPTTDIEKLRLYLYQNNFIIDDEILTFDHCHYYVTLVVSMHQESVQYNDYDLYIGPHLKFLNSPILQKYLLYKYNYLQSLPLKLVNFDLKKAYQVIKEFLNEKKWIN